MQRLPDVDRPGFDAEGYCVLSSPNTLHQLEALRSELSRVLDARQSVMREQGIVQGTAGTGHHLLERDSVFLSWLGGLAESSTLLAITQALGAPAVLNSFGAVDNRRGVDQYVGHVHRDVRIHTRELRLMTQILVPLDEFNAETGATWLLPASHLRAEEPDRAAFFDAARQICASPGQLILFDSRVWHAAGTNVTENPRRALTLTFTRSFIKPQFDYCRYLGYDYVEQLPEPLKQLLGFFARVPATLSEWYQPPQSRFYRKGQD